MKPAGTTLLLEPTFIDTEDDKARKAGLVVSSIQLPKHQRPVEEYAKVIAVGPDVTVAKAGDTVFYKDYNADRVLQDGDVMHLFIDQKYVLAVESKKK